jgi:ABC-type dipeptide/oligopeptide/nickel transport system ATPase component
MASDATVARAHYSPPWADVSIIGIAGSSGSGKSTLSHAIVSALNLPWVVILSMVYLSPDVVGLMLTRTRTPSTKALLLSNPQWPLGMSGTLTHLMPLTSIFSWNAYRISNKGTIFNRDNCGLVAETFLGRGLRSLFTRLQNIRDRKRRRLYIHHMF